MASRSDLSPPAATGVWVVSVIGSWTMAAAILGSINDAVIGCDRDSASPAADTGGVAGWLIVATAALVPVLVMVAVAPARMRRRLIGLAVVAAGAGLAAASAWSGPCL